MEARWCRIRFYSGGHEVTGGRVPGAIVFGYSIAVMKLRLQVVLAGGLILASAVSAARPPRAWLWPESKAASRSAVASYSWKQIFRYWTSPHGSDARSVSTADCRTLPTHAERIGQLVCPYQPRIRLITAVLATISASAECSPIVDRTGNYPASRKAAQTRFFTNTSIQKRRRSVRCWDVLDPNREMERTSPAVNVPN